MLPLHHVTHTLKIHVVIVVIIGQDTTGGAKLVNRPTNLYLPEIYGKSGVCDVGKIGRRFPLKLLKNSLYFTTDIPNGHPLTLQRNTLFITQDTLHVQGADLDRKLFGTHSYLIAHIHIQVPSSLRHKALYALLSQTTLTCSTSQPLPRHSHPVDTCFANVP